MAQRTSSLLTPEQRDRLRGIPPEFSDREIARYYTFTPADLAAINRRRRGYNRLGFAVQLAMLRFPGRTLADIVAIPPRVLTYLADQVGVPSAAFERYGQRENTIYEHLDEIRTVFGYTNYDWRAMRRLMIFLLPLAMESDHPLPLAEAALEQLRTLKVIAPGITTLEDLLHRGRRRAERTVHRRLAQTLSDSQRAALDALLVMPTRGRYSGLSCLAWLRIGPGNPSAAQLQHILDRMAFLQDLALPSMPPQLHRNRMLQVAQRGNQYQAGPLASFAAEKRYALLFASVSELSHDLIDQSLAMFDDLWIELLRKGEASQTRQVVKHARALNRDVYLLAAVLEAIVQAESAGTDPFAAVYTLVHRDQVATTIERIRGMLRPPDFDYLDLVAPKYLPLRQALLRFIRLLTFQPFRATDPALLALNYVLRLEQRKTRVTSITMPVGRTTQTAPLAHLTDRWRPYALKGTQIEPTYYEAAAFDRLRSGLRSGDIAVAASRRYQTFDSYLLPKAYWDQLCASDMTRLAENGTAQAYLEEQKERIHTQLTALQQELGPASGLTLAADGTLHLAALEAVVPAAAKTLSRRAYRLLPRIDLPDLLREVNEWTGFLDQATHLTTALPLFRDESTTLLAALMGTGMNLSLTSLAKASPFTYRQLAWASDWYLREETLRAMLVTLDNFVLQLPFARMWGDGSRSTSDGLRLRVGVQAPNADRNSNYFDDGRGITLYLHLADLGPPLYNQVISTNDSEAWYVIDGLCNHETEFNIEEHSTDTGGSSVHVFGLCHFLGFRFLPRLADPVGQRLWTIGRAQDYGPLNQLLAGSVSERLIRDHWEELRYLAGSIRNGATPASILMKKLASYPRQNQMAQGLGEVGKVERSDHLITLLRSEAARRQAAMRQDRHEGANALGRSVFFGRRGMLWERTFQDQLHRTSCLVVLMAAIMAWNTVHLADAIADLRGRGFDAPDELLAHIAPTGWRHLNFLGRYPFNGPIYTLANRRPLRSETTAEVDDLQSSEEPSERDGSW